MGPTGSVFLLFLVLVCGRPVYSGRIVGGQDTVEGHWPWQVSLHYGQTHICGGSLISDRWILTAAHCLQKTWIPFIYSVWLGSIKIDYLNNGVKHHVFKIIFHPQSQNTTADIALLKLASRVTFTSFILPICLPNITKQLTIPGSCWVTGWGQVKENEGNYTSTLQEAEIPVIDRRTCDYLYNPLIIIVPELEAIIKEDMICAGDIHRKDSCKGDSGGPLSCHIDGVWTLIGLVSWGLGCAESLPGVYTNVIYYQKWIKATISRAEVWGPTIWTYLTYCSLFCCSLWLSWYPTLPLGLTSYQEYTVKLKPLTKYRARKRKHGE